MRYKCLVLDHDDTVVNSTATIHYPAFLAYIEETHKDIKVNLEDYFSYNFEPGVIGMFRDIYGLNEKEMVEEEDFWREYVKDHIPLVYPGMKEILWDYKTKGGLIAVVSHSYSDYIRRDYAYNELPEPDIVFGWDLEPEKRKPDPYALYEIEKKFHLLPEEMLVLDDLKPGYDMARAAGVPFAAAGWANDVPAIENFMRKNCDFYFKQVEEFGKFLSGGRAVPGTI